MRNISNYDPELPAGFQDADFEMRSLQAQARRDAALRKKGICTHGWVQGPPGPESEPRTNWKCLDCGQEFDVDPWTLRKNGLD